eukprot:270501_1
MAYTTHVRNELHYSVETLELQDESPHFVLSMLQLSLVILLKVIGHFCSSVIIDPKHGKVLAIVLFVVSQCGICYLHDLHSVIHWLSFIVMSTSACVMMICLERFESPKKFVFTMGSIELFWLLSCNDISCIAAYIMIFEGCFVQRIKEEYTSCKWTDSHLLCFAVCKIIFISWIYVSLNWIISLCEMLYFVIPFLSLKLNRCKLKLSPDQWFLMDGCSHFFLFFFWWFSSSNWLYSA